MIVERTQRNILRCGVVWRNIHHGVTNEGSRKKRSTMMRDCHCQHYSLVLTVVLPVSSTICASGRTNEGAVWSSLTQADGHIWFLRGGLLYRS